MRAKILALVALVLIVGYFVQTKAQDALRFEPAKVLSTVDANYPPNVVNPGTVVLEVTVGRQGDVEDVKVDKDAPGFTEEAQRVVREWKFKAATLDGEAIRSTIVVAFSFSQPLVAWPH
jgi:protein TonB